VIREHLVIIILPGIIVIWLGPWFKRLSPERLFLAPKCAKDGKSVVPF
jgi:hypothetical protein